MPETSHDRRGTPAASSRREFLRRLAQGSVGMAVLPGLGAVPSSLAAEGPGSLGGGAADEEFWRRVRGRFDLRAGVVPMNAANLCPAPRAVVEASVLAQRDVEADVSHQNRAKYDRLMDEVRAKLAAYLGAEADEVALVRNTSEANNIVAGGLVLGPGDEVVLFDENHQTNSLSWEVRAERYGFTVRRVAVAGPVESPEQVVDAFRAALGPRTRVLAFSDVSNSSGLRLPTRELCLLGRERGIYVHVDGAQTFGALRRHLHDLGCDSYSASAHKWLMGPKEVGVLYVRRERIPELWPGVVGVGWGRDTGKGAEGAAKFETLGQRNDASIAALDVALDFHAEMGPERVEARVHELGAALKAGIAAIAGARVVTPASPAVSAGVVVARFEGRDMRQIYTRLYDEHGIAGASTGGVRLCPHVYNTLEDVDRAVAALRAVVRSLT